MEGHTRMMSSNISEREESALQMLYAFQSQPCGNNKNSGRHSPDTKVLRYISSNKLIELLLKPMTQVALAVLNKIF